MPYQISPLSPVPFAPDNSGLQQLLMQQGQQRANSALASGQIWQNAIGGIGNAVSRGIDTYQQNKTEQQRIAIAQQKADQEAKRQQAEDAYKQHEMSLKDEEAKRQAAEYQDRHGKAQAEIEASIADYMGGPVADRISDHMQHDPDKGAAFLQQVHADAASRFGPEVADRYAQQFQQGGPQVLEDWRANSPTYQRSQKEKAEKEAAAAQQGIVNAREAERLGLDQKRFGLEQSRVGIAQKELDLKTNPMGGQGGIGANAGGLAGDDFLKTLPAQKAEEVKAYAEGRRPFPTGRTLASPYFQDLIAAVGQYDPGFDAVNYQARAQSRKDFTSGKTATQIRNLNTVVGHLGDMMDKAEKLDNTDYPAFNAIRNTAKTAMGSPDVTNFDTIKKGVVDELTNVWRQSGGTEADIKTWATSLSNASSWDQFKGVGSTVAGMLESRLSALEEQKRQGMGEGGKDLEVISPKARAVLDRLQGLGDKPDAQGWTTIGGLKVRVKQ